MLSIIFRSRSSHLFVTLMFLGFFVSLLAVPNSLQAVEDPGRGAFCTAELSPVCATNGATYSNTCWMDSAGAEFDYWGDCEEEPEIDPAFEPTAEMEEAWAELEGFMNDLVEEIELAESEGYDLSTIEDLFLDLIAYTEENESPSDEESFWNAMVDIYDFLYVVYDELDYIYETQDIYEPAFEPTQEMGEALVGLGTAMIDLGERVDEAEANGYDLSTIDAFEDSFTVLAEYLQNPLSEATFWNDLEVAWGLVEEIEAELEHILRQGIGEPEPIDFGEISEMREALYEVDENMRKLGVMLEWFTSLGADLSPLEDTFLEVARLFLITEEYLNEEDVNGFWDALYDMETYIDEVFLLEMEDVLLSSDVGMFLEQLGYELEAIDEEVSYLQAAGEYVPGVYDDILALTDEISAAFDNENFSQVTEMIDYLVILIDDFWYDVGEEDYTISFEPPAGYEDEVITFYSDNPFPDTDDNSLEGIAAADLYRRAVIGGFPDGEFKGARPVNRAEAAKFLLLAAGIEVFSYENRGHFSDVVDGQWYTPFVMTCSEHEIINGYPDGSFRPADPVNTVEFLKMLNLAFGVPINLPFSYADVPSSAWYASYAGIAETYDLFPDRTSHLYPARELTRNEVAVAIYQYLKNEFIIQFN